MLQVKQTWWLFVALVFAGVVAAQGQQTFLPDLIKKAEAGDPEAQFQAGRAYEDGSGVEQNDLVAAQWYRKAADQGYSKAENSMGLMYRAGKGVNLDKLEAVRWYLRSALQCDPNGAYNLAIAYYNGDGVPADSGWAFVWLLVAKQCGNPDTKTALDQIASEMTIKQRANAEERLVAYALSTPEFKPDVDEMLRAMQTLNPSVAYEICRVYADKKTKRRDPAKAKGWCEKAVTLDSTEAYLVLGALAEENNDFAGAAAVYAKAVNAKEFSAAGPLGVLYLEGKGVQQDSAEAYFWLYLANKSFGYDIAFKNEFDRASKQLPGKEKKKQEKRAKKWEQMQTRG